MKNYALTVLGFSVIFIATTCGAALVFLIKKNISERLNALFLGFSAGIMIAASIWSLLLPSIEGAESVYKNLKFIPAVAGFIAGGVFLAVLNKFAPETDRNDDYSGSLYKSLKTFVAMTVHNIPEGLAVGFAFGAAARVGTQAATLSALGLAVGIAVQNFPEGAAVSLPLYRVTGSRGKSFALGMASGAVEPVAATIGYFLSSYLVTAQPWFLAFAAGAMLFVVAEDIIPDAKINGTHTGTWGVMAGFAIMMLLDVAL